jgi:hypothetical protein
MYSEGLTHIFSASLEMLTITITSNEWRWTDVAVPPILWRLFRRKSRFPKLRKITLVYHLEVAEQEQSQRWLGEQERKIPPGVRGAAKRELIAANWRRRG